MRADALAAVVESRVDPLEAKGLAGQIDREILAAPGSGPAIGDELGADGVFEVRLGAGFENEAVGRLVGNVSRRSRCSPAVDLGEPELRPVDVRGRPGGGEPGQGIQATVL